ncbi:MAG: phenylacetate--CoA ligase family protein [Rhodobacterales bacterium]|nr:phenylacetate--CoA ligase family protein [Rhodobacterales bacterium]
MKKTNLILDLYLTLRGVIYYNSFLKKSQNSSLKEMHAHQEVWLKKLLHHAYSNVPWYTPIFRELGIKLDSNNPFEELKKLPILTKQEVRENHSGFCIPEAAKNSLSFSTSGTSGEPLSVYTSKNQWVVEQGVIWRQWKWAGYNFRNKIAIFRSYAPNPGEPSIKIDHLRNWAYFSVFRMDESHLDEYVQFLKRWKPKFLRGYPSALKLVAEHALKRNWKLPSLKAALSASEVVPEGLRETLRAAFGIELFDHYGQAEITCMFHDCEEHEGMHVDWEYGYVELLPTSRPNIYRIIATNLHNMSMPLLRYDTGDLAVGEWESCKCGRKSLILKEIQGRMDDYILAFNGSKLTTVNLYTYFSKVNDIQRFQMIQEQIGELIILVEFKEGVSKNNCIELQKTITRELTEKTGLRIDVKFSSDFVQSSEGKFVGFIQRANQL